MVVALTERELRQDKIGWTLTRLMNFQTIRPKWGFRSLSVHEPHDFVSFLYLSFFFSFFFLTCLLLSGKERRSVRGKIGVFFPKTKLTLQDWIIMFSFFVLVVLLHAGLFFLGGGGEGG